MTPDGLFVLGALLAAFVAIYRGWVGADLALMSGLGVVVAVGGLDPSALMHGFATTAVVAVASLYVVLAGLLRTFDDRGPVGARLAAVADRWGWSSAVRHGCERRDGRGREQLEKASPWVAVGALAVGAGLFVVGSLSFEAAALLTATSYVVAGVVPADTARSAVDWEVVVAVGALIGFSRALVETGVASWLSAAAVGTPAAATWTPVLVAVALLLPMLADRRVAA